MSEQGAGQNIPGQNIPQRFATPDKTSHAVFVTPDITSHAIFVTPDKTSHAIFATPDKTSHTQTASTYGERSGSVVECFTRDRRAAGSSLTGVTALCPWARTLTLA